MRQIKPSEWGEIVNPTELCRLAISYEIVEIKLGMKFFNYVEEGLGPAKGLFIESDSCQYFIRVVLPPVGQPSDGMLVFMRSYELSPYKMLVALSAKLELNREKYVWVREPVCGPQWQVWNVSKEETNLVYAFHEKHSALSLIDGLNQKTNDSFEIRFVEDLKRELF